MKCFYRTVLEDGAHLGDAPAAWTEAGAAGVGVGEAVDASPGVLGPVVGLALGWAGHDAEAGMVVEPSAESAYDEVVAVVLPCDLGAEVAAEHTVNLAPGMWVWAHVIC